MYSLVLRIVHNTRVKDTIAIARGLYRVSQGALTQSSSSRVRSSSWMDLAIKQPHIQSNNNLQKSNSKLNNLKEEPHQSNIKEQLIMSTTLKQKIIQDIKDQNLTNKDSQLKYKPKQQNNIEKQKQSPKINMLKSSETKIQPIKQIQNKKQEKIYLKQLNNYNLNRKINNQNSLNTPQQQISAIPSSRIGRILQFGKLGLSLASASIFSKDKDQSYYQDAAQKITSQLCKMRGAPLKLAQMLSIQQQNLIPAPIRKAFQKARQSAHVIPIQQVELMLGRNLGEGWMNRFKQFNKIPFASASIGQVHKGKLFNGQQVAVKIQYYQVKQSINSDIQNLGLLLKLPGLMPKGMYVQRILKNMKIELMQECDYMQEKFYQQKYEEYLIKSFGIEESKLYRVPKIYPQYTTSQILTSQYITGIKMKQLQQGQYPQELRDQIGRRIMKLTFKQLFQMGIMQSDPNPANFTYNSQRDQLNLYDFGATHIYKKDFLLNYYKIIEGSVKKDQEQIWQASIKTGFVTGQENMVMKNGHIQSIMITGQPLRHKGIYNFGQQQITNRIYKTIPLMLKNRIKPPPQQVYSLHRKLSGSYLACIRLKARVDCSRIFQQIKFQSMASHQKYQPIKSDDNMNNIEE